MALSFSNTLGNALNNAMTPQPLSQTSSPSTNKGPNPLQYLGISSGYAFGGKPLMPTAATPQTAPTATTPASAAIKPAPTQPLASSAIASPAAATYKGVSITPGTDQQVASQIATIDGGQKTAAPTATTGTTASMTPPATPPATTYSGLVGGLASNTASNAASPAGQLAATGATNPGTSGQAYTDYQTAVQNLADLKSKIAAQEGAQASQPIPLQFQQGRQQAEQNQYAAQLDAAQQAVVQAQQGLGYQIQGTQVQQTGLNEAGGLQNSALSSAASSAQPSPASFGQTTFNPLTGNYEGSGGLPPDVLQQYAQMAANGQYSAIPSSITGNPVLSAQLNQAAQAINPAYNPISSSAQGAASASNIQTAGTTATNIAAQGAGTAVQAYNTLNAANTTFDQQASQVLSVLSQGKLDGSIPDVNAALNKIGGKLGSTQVQALSSSLAELNTAYTQLLSSGNQTPTAADQQALATLNPNSSAAMIATSIQQLKAAAQIKLNSAKTLASGYGNALGGGGESSGTNYNF